MPDRRIVIRLGRLDLEVELAFAPTEEAALGLQPEPDEALRTGRDTDRGRVERPVDTLGAVDQVQPAARQVVAMVLDHELVRGAATAAPQAAATS